MKTWATPYTLNLRRAHHIQIVLFGAFLYCYAAHLHYPTITALLRLSPLEISPQQIGVLTAALGMLIVTLTARFSHFPKSWSGERRLLICIAATFIFCLATSPSEQEAAYDRAEYYRIRGEYEQALTVTERIAHPSPKILAQRALLLTLDGDRLCENFFTYPIGQGISPDSLSIRQLPSSHITHLHALLHRNLNALAQQLKSTPHDSLQRAEREALILYKHLHANPIIVLNDENTEANYRDFCALQEKLQHSPRHYSPVELANIIGDTYGDTYWHYYLYGKYR